MADLTPLGLRRRRWLAVALVLGACGGAPDVQPESPHPCDPYGTDRPVSPPADRSRELTCGNDRIDEYLTECSEQCQGGCGLEESCRTVCPPSTEACDGTALGGQDCASLGFSGGSLSCTADCLGLETAACDPCADAACREIVLPPTATSVLDLEVHAIGRGRARRARLFWSDPEGLLHSAELDLTLGTVGEPTELGWLSERWPVVTTSRSFLALVGTETSFAIVVLDAAGMRTEGLGLPNDVGSVRIFAAPDRDGAVIVQGELGSNEVRALFVDARGRPSPWPREVVIGVHPLERMVVAPIAAGPHTLRIGTSSLDVSASRDDRVLAIGSGGRSDADTRTTSATLLHAGVGFPAVGDTWANGGDTLEIGGGARITFSPDAVAIDAEEVWRAPSPTPSSSFAPVVSAEAIVESSGLRSATFDLDGSGPIAPRLVVAP